MTHHSTSDPQTRDHTRAAGERGQTAAEYVGVVALAAAAIGLILKLHIAEDIAQGLAQSIKTILGG